MADRALIVNESPHRSPVNTMNYNSMNRPPGATMTASYNSMNQSPGNTVSSSYRAMTMEGANGNFSTMEQQSFHAESKSEFSSMFSSDGGTTVPSESISRFPQNATSEIRQLDANQNHMSKIGSVDTQSLRKMQSESDDSRTQHRMQSESADTRTQHRMQSESADTRTQQRIQSESSGTTVNGGTTTVVIPQSMVVAECATAEMKGGGTTSMTSEVHRRGMTYYFT